MEIAIVILVVTVALIIAGVVFSWYNECVKLETAVKAKCSSVRAAYQNYLRAKRYAYQLEKEFSDLDVSANQSIINEAGTITGTGFLFGGTERFPHYSSQRTGTETYNTHIAPFVSAKNDLINACEKFNCYLLTFPRHNVLEKFDFQEQDADEIIDKIISDVELEWMMKEDI